MISFQFNAAVLLAVCLCAFSSCSSPDTHNPNSVLLRGHVTLSAGGACFVNESYTKSYLVTNVDMPEQVWNFVKAQEPHIDMRSDSNKSQSAFIEAHGELLKFNERTQRFKVTKLISLTPAHKDYLVAWTKFPFLVPSP